MKKCVFQSLTVRFLIILSLTFGSFFSNRVIAQKDSEEAAFTLPFKQCWSYPTKMTNRNIASDNKGKIIIPTLEGKLLALDSNSGVKLWETEMGGEVISNLIDDKEKKNVYVVTKSFSNRKENYKNSPSVFYHNKNNHQQMTIKLRSLDKTTGITNWQTSLLLTGTLNTKSKISVFAYDHKVITVDQSGNMMAFSENDGKSLWKKPLNLEVSNADFDVQGKSLVILSKNGVILANLDTAESVFYKETDSIFTAVYLFNKTTMALGNKKGEVFAVDTKTKKNIWKFRAGAEISNINSTPKGLLVTSFDNFIYLVAPESGRVIWKRRLEGRLIIEPFLIANNIVVTTLGSSKAIIISLDEGKPVNQIYLSVDNYFVSRPVFSNRLIIFPTADGMYAFTNSDNKCAEE